MELSTIRGQAGSMRCTKVPTTTKESNSKPPRTSTPVRVKSLEGHSNIRNLWLVRICIYNDMQALTTEHVQRAFTSVTLGGALIVRFKTSFSFFWGTFSIRCLSFSSFSFLSVSFISLFHSDLFDSDLFDSGLFSFSLVSFSFLSSMFSCISLVLIFSSSILSDFSFSFFFSSSSFWISLLSF